MQFFEGSESKMAHIIHEYRSIQREAKPAYVCVDEAATHPINQSKNRYT